MTNVLVTVGVNNVSADVINVDTWGSKATVIGSCKILLDNSSDTWGGTFAPNDAITITVGGTPLFVGLVDNVKPYLDREGVLSNYLEVTGRDEGRYLIDYYITKNYKNQAAGVIIDDILDELGDPLAYTDPGGTPSIKYNCQRTRLGDAIRDICELSGYDFYIDITGRLHFIVAGAEDTGADLICVQEDTNSNLLAFEEYEQVGFDIKNYIEIHAGSVKDHWTEENEGDYTVLFGAGAINDETTALYMFGVGSIEVVDDANDITVGLDFPAGPGGKLYSYASLDMTKYGQAKVVFRPENASTGAFDFRPVLIDTTARQITFTRKREGRSSKGYTENHVASDEVWHPLSFPVGAHDDNQIVAAQKSGYWHGDVAFTWNAVAKVGFQLVTGAGMDTIYFDALYIPSIEARSISEDAGGGSSQALYGVRMHSEYRRELKSQKELDDYSTKILALKKDPIQKFRATTIGEPLTLYVAQSVEVQAPDYGIAGLTPYIIVQLRHTLHNNRNFRGWDWQTQYELVEQDTQPIRVIRDNSPIEALLMEMYRRLFALEAATMDEDYWLGEVMTGVTPQIERGAAFPTDMRDGDEFFLTADLTVGASEYYGPALYKYDDTAGDWIRNPIVMHRAAVPPGGGEITSDIYYNTVTNIIYQWTGAAWLKIGVSYISDAFDYGTVEWPTDQLAIEMRPWTGNFSIIWDDKDDEPPADWNHFKWGQKDNENAVDATIKYADGTTVDVNFGQDINLAPDGDWFAYWDEAQKTGGDYDVQWTQVYSNASGVGKGLLAVVNVRNAATESPSVMLYNTYIPAMGVGSLVAHSIYSKHISTDWLTGKNYRTAVDVGVALGPAGVRFDSTGIFGYSGGIQKTFQLLAASGSVTTYGAGLFRIRKADLTLTGYIDGTVYNLGLGAGNQDTLAVKADTDELLIIESHAKWIGLDGPNDRIIVDSNFDRIQPDVARGVDLGMPAYPFRYFVPVTAVALRPAAGVAVNGLLWCSREGAGTKGKYWICLMNDANAYEWVLVAETS